MAAFPPVEVYASGKHKSKSLAAVEADYAARLGKHVQLYIDNSATETRQNAFYDKAYRPHTAVIACDENGTTYSSSSFSQLLASIAVSARTPVFLIGGDRGLTATQLSSAHYRLAFGAMTWPHLLVRVMLLEQLYRAQCILSGHPYHREGKR